MVTMNKHSGFEMKAGSALIALMVFLLAFVAHFGVGDPLHLALAARGRDDDWALALAMVATMLLYGSLRPKRTCRHIGLVLTLILMAAITGLVFQAGVTTPVTMSVLLPLVLIPLTAWLYLADVAIGVRHRASF